MCVCLLALLFLSTNALAARGRATFPHNKLCHGSAAATQRRRYAICQPTSLFHLHSYTSIFMSAAAQYFICALSIILSLPFFYILSCAKSPGNLVLARWCFASGATEFAQLKLLTTMHFYNFYNIVVVFTRKQMRKMRKMQPYTTIYTKVV